MNWLQLDELPTLKSEPAVRVLCLIGMKEMVLGLQEKFVVNQREPMIRNPLRITLAEAVSCSKFVLTCKLYMRPQRGEQQHILLAIFILMANCLLLTRA